MSERNFTKEDVLDRTERFLNAPCLICGGVEGCSHTAIERARAALSPDSLVQVTE